MRLQVLKLIGHILVSDVGENMKKMLLLGLFLILLTGCSAQYNLKIDKDKIEENVEVSFPKNTTDRTLLEPYLTIANRVYPKNDNLSDVYKTSLDEDDYNYYLRYNYNHSYDLFDQSLFLNQCYEDVSFVYTDEQVELSTSNMFMCLNMLDDGLYLNDASIRITTDMKVVNNNADSVDGNTYIWNVNNSKKLRIINQLIWLYKKFLLL